MFEFLVLVIFFGVLAGAELVNLFMLAQLSGSASRVQAPAVMREWGVQSAERALLHHSATDIIKQESSSEH